MVMDAVEVVGRGDPLVPLVTGDDLPKTTIVPQQHRGRFASTHTLTKRSYKHGRGPEHTPGKLRTRRLSRVQRERETIMDLPLNNVFCLEGLNHRQ